MGGGHTHGHLDRCDAQRPNVGFVVIILLLDHFRRHPKRSADKCAALGHSGGDLACNTKIGKFDGPVLSEKNVRSFYVTMNLPFSVKVVKTTEYLCM